MAPLGPFEPAPTLALAVSGGPDSLALALLAQSWARRRRGQVVALTVDHRLRRGSAAEARQVGAWLSGRGIAHQVLRSPERPSSSGIQARARAVRYALLTAWCRRRGVLHLLLAHQREDQAETVLLRLARGGGIDGLAAMAALQERDGVRIVRPLLGCPRARLQATLAARRQAWLDDPSNADPRFERVRLRRLMPALAPVGLGVPALAATAARAGAARAVLEALVAVLAAEAVALHPAGFALVDLSLLEAAPEELRRRLLSRLLACVGGAAWPPRGARLERLLDALAGDALAGGRTLGGCRIRRWRGRLLVCREPAAVAGAASLTPGRPQRWDRFAVRLAGPAREHGPWRVGPLGREGVAALRAAGAGTALPALPGPVRVTLPALWRGRLLAAVPHAGRLARDGVAFSAVFRPLRPLAPPGFRVV